jgi:prephenate dehydrogenase
MKDLKQITVIGLGLLGSSITLAVLRAFSNVKTIGYAHRSSTRAKARDLAVADEVSGDLAASVTGSDVIILATPISTFENFMEQIRPHLRDGCIVTDVGSTKVLPHRWAGKKLGSMVHYVGSHPIAGSEQRGVEFARDDLFDGADCILTSTKTTDKKSLAVLGKFWSELGCHIKYMSPAKHDRIYANVSHLPHVLAAALVNASSQSELEFSGKGFMDTSRVASGPENIWTDIIAANPKNISVAIKRTIDQLQKLQGAIDKGDIDTINKLLATARKKRAMLINYKLKKRELLK